MFSKQIEHMEATLLWKILQGFCYEFHWDYAVFWKLHPEQMLLKWEEGYCYNPTVRGSIESEPVDREFDIADPIFSSTWGSSQPDGYSYEFSTGISLDDLRNVKYHLGEGVVGKSISTGNYSWILSEKLLVCDFESNMVPECPDEWLLQFATGIKTIVLIPVAQHGVLQLGSSKKVGEDPTLVALVRNKFSVYLNTVDVVPTSSLECDTKTSSSPIYTNLCGFPISMVSQMKPEYAETVFAVNNNTPTMNQTMPFHLVEDVCYFSREIRVDNDNISCQLGGLDEMLQLDHGILGEMSEITKIDSSIEDIKSLTCPGYNFGIFGQDKNIEAKLVEHFVDENTNSSTNINSLFNFSMDCELHKALGSTFQMQSNNPLWNRSVASEDSQSSSSVLLNRNLNQGNEFLICGDDDDEEHQLDTVYATIDSYLNYDISKEPNDIKSSVESLDRLSAPVVVNGSKNAATQKPCPSLTENSLSTLVNEQKIFTQNEQKMKKGYTHPQSKGSKVCRKRAGPAEKPKPRPRDRQLIQDRVKELRELVPNGSKCSIDGLLDSTIKHMMFLRGISERAGKLRHWVNEEVTGYKKMRLSSPEHDSKKGTSWAYEIGSDFQACPIVVKDLEHPGHMLIEMLCNDNGLFLEVAEVIRRFDLTILKGLMESRPDNTWAHFIVEVSKGFQRLDIFWPLMQVLQKNRTPVSG